MDLSIPLINTPGDTRNLRLDLEYDGRNYCGWQWQPDLPTIEGVVKSAIEKIVGHTIILYSSGRTDAGVHAEQHVAQFFSPTKIPAINLMRGINSLLPEDICVYRVMDMAESWRARQDALEREYRYSFYCHETPSVFLRHRTYWFKDPLNIEAMRTAAVHLEGRHDFSAFRSLHCDAEHSIRTVLEMAWIENLPLLHLKVRGHAFLRHQVRTFAGTLLDVGLEKIDPDYVKTILDSKDRSLAGPTLPAHGLTLMAVRYAGDSESFSPKKRFVWE